MALRNRNEWVNGDIGWTGSWRAYDAVLWDEAAWTDHSTRWDALWTQGRLGARRGALQSEDATASNACGCFSCALTRKLDQALKAEANDPSGGDSGAGAAPPSPSVDDPQFLGPGDTIGDNTSSTTSIAVGGSISSSVNAVGDVDYIKVNLVAGQTYTFSLDGGTLSDPYLELRDATGAVVNDGVLSDDGGINFDAFMMHRATTTGEYWIVARHFANGTGTYTLDVDAIQTGNSSPTTFIDNGKPQFSWEEAGIQISRDGAGWMSAFGSSAVVTYAYRSDPPGAMPEDTGGFSRFNAAQIIAAEETLAAWAAVANITFVRVDQGDGYSNNATILFGNYSSGAEGAAAFAYLPTTGNTAASSVQGDVWISVEPGVNNPGSYNLNPVRGDYG